MSLRTIYLSKLLGLYFILVALPMVFQKQAVVDMTTKLLHEPSLIFVVGLLTLAAGLAMVLAHNVWCGGVLPVVVTVIGWLTLAKGFALLCMLSCDAAGLYLGTMHYSQLFYLYMAICLVLGAYLTYAGFTAKKSS